MKLTVFSHKPCWPCATSPTGYATDGGFSFQMKALSELFDETRLLVPCYPRGDGTGEIALEGHKLSVLPLSARRGTGLSSKLSFFPWLLVNCRPIMRELLAAEAVHAPIPGDVGTVGMVGAWFFRKPLFVRYCGNWLTVETAAERFWHWFMERFAGGGNVMLATGGTDHPPSSKTSDIHWIFSTSLSGAEIRELARNQVELDPENLRLVIVGRQEADKGTDLLIRALPLIHRQYPNSMVDVVGDGSAVRGLKRTAAELGIGEKVAFRGKVNHAEVIRILQGAHVFCFPTQSSEGFPKAVLEALACGLPVITTRVSVLPMLLANGCGVLTEPDPDAIAGAVCGILSSLDRYKLMSAKAREAAREYTLEHWRDTIGGHLSQAWGPLKQTEKQPPLNMLKGLRVCFLAGTLGQGGAERQLFYIASALKASGVEVLVLSLTSGEVWASRLEANGIPVQFVGASASRMKRLLAISSAVTKFRPGIVQSQHFYTNGYSAIAARLCGARSVGAVRGNGLSDMRDCGHFARLCLRLPRRLAANSQAAMRNLVSLGCRPEKLFHLPNAIDLTQFLLPGFRNGERITILGVGRFVPPKRFDRFLRILALLRQSCSLPFKALIAGDGPLRPDLERLARDSGLFPGTVEFCGNVPDVRSLYSQAHILLLTSDHEGTPNVVMEAMACGLPVVATAVGDVPELVEHGLTGYVIGTGDEEGAARHLLELMQHAGKREAMGRRARSFIQEHHALEALPGHLARLYSERLA